MEALVLVLVAVEVGLVVVELLVEMLVGELAVVFFEVLVVELVVEEVLVVEQLVVAVKLGSRVSQGGGWARRCGPSYGPSCGPGSCGSATMISITTS